MCSDDFAYYNGSCVITIYFAFKFLTENALEFHKRTCNQTKLAKTGSIHSLTEHWFVYNLYLSTIPYTFGGKMYIGGEFGDLTNNQTNNWTWADNTPYDYSLATGFYKFARLQPITSKGTPAVMIM